MQMYVILDIALCASSRKGSTETCRERGVAVAPLSTKIWNRVVELLPLPCLRAEILGSLLFDSCSGRPARWSKAAIVPCRWRPFLAAVNDVSYLDAVT